jgi:hypothetical protein
LQSAKSDQPRDNRRHQSEYSSHILHRPEESLCRAQVGILEMATAVPFKSASLSTHNKLMMQGADVIYRMAGMSVDSGNVAEDAFTLPDGTVLHESALDGANR